MGYALSNPSNLIEHDIDEHTSNRNIEPNRERPARDPLVANEICPDCVRDCNKHQRHNHNCQKGMGQQDREVDHADGALPRKCRRAVEIVVSKIGN